MKQRAKRRAPQDAEGLAASIAAQVAPRAGSFIVTLYGDVVEPRGLPLWMGDIIEVCGAVGLSETLVRTAVSRLVASGRLIGDRQGRRSYYRLTQEARLEFARAARVLFEPKDAPGWRLLRLPPDHESGALERAGFVRLGGGWFLGPAHEDLVLEGVAAFSVLPLDPAALPGLVATEWNVGLWDEAYGQFIGMFEPLRVALAAGEVFSDALCLKLRLLLVHAYRLAALRDPHLPREALPADWSGLRARALFADLYLSLSPGADRRAGDLLSDQGHLPRETDVVARRRQTLGGAV